MYFVKRCGALVGALLLALALVVTIAPQGASAHERRDIVGGKYQAVVGFLTEPAYQGQMNSLDLTVTSKTDKNADGTAKGIEGLEKTLKAQVISNGKTLDLPVQARFNLPGKYAAYFQPTVAGQYSFRVYGTINGENVDEKFSSGPNTFGDVQPIAALQFPESVAAPADLQAQLDAAKSAADNARLIAIAGVVVGVLALVVAGLALLRRPAATAGAGQVTSRPSEGDD
jgi:hypothetical protein